MSVCEHHQKYSSQTQSETTTSEKLSPKLIQDELIWGLSYRDHKRREKENSAITPKKSPIDIPFKLCRERQKKKRKRKSSKDNPESKGKGKTRKISLLERSVLSQTKYMEQLAIPNPKFVEPPVKKRKRKCELEPCPPRLVQLAVPSKRRVLANWKDYHELLPTEILVRYQKLLHTNKNLEPRDARYHYKKLDKAKRAQLRLRKRLRKKKREEKQKGDQKWLNQNIEDTANVILEYIKDSPHFALNYKQLMLSDGILSRLERHKAMKKPCRSTKSDFKRTIIEVSDKLALWLDTLTRFVDIQAIESEEDIPPLSISSLGESEAELSSDLSGEDEGGEGDQEEDEGEEEEQEGESEDGREDAQNILFDLGKLPGPEDGVSDYILTDEEMEGIGYGDILHDMDGDVLEKLLEILSNTTDDFLESLVDNDKFPGVKYRDILDKLKEMKDEITDHEKKTTLENIIVDWAMQNDPDKVDNKVLGKIHDTAALINEWLCSRMKGDEHDFVAGAFDEAEYGEGTEGEDGEVGEGDEEGEDGVSNKSDMILDDSWVKVELEDEEEEGEGDVSGAMEGEDLEAEGLDLYTEGAVGEETHEGWLERDRFGEGGYEDEEYGEYPQEGEEFGVQPKVQEEHRESLGFDVAPYAAEEADHDRMPTLLDFGDISGLSDQLEPTTSGEVAEGASGLTEGEIPHLEKGEEEEEEGIRDIQATKITDQQIDIIYKPGEQLFDDVIKGHKPRKVLEHSPTTVCCLSLKIWAVWLLEITHNAHNWTKWVQGIIKKVREFASTVRGDVVLPDGRKKVLLKSDWRKFVTDTEEKIVAWRQYGAHVKDLSTSIVENFHGKSVNCCPKCLEDHLIRNVVTAHETLQALTEAMNCASYWHRCLDEIVEKTLAMADFESVNDAPTSLSSSESDESGDMADIEELQPCICKKFSEQESGESIYEIEELEINPNPRHSYNTPRPQ